MTDITALGELLIDFASVGETAEGYPVLEANPGGAPGNYLAAAAACGADTAMLGKVGNDAFGKLLIGTMEKAGIETRGISVDDGCFTTLAFVTVDENGDRSFSFARKPGADTRLSWEDLNLSLIDEARIFHFGTLSMTDEPARSATGRAVSYAREKGKLLSFDPNLRMPLWASEEVAREQILWGLQNADIIKLSEEELQFVWNCSIDEGAEKLLKEFGAKLVMISLGAEGARLFNPRAEVFEPPLKVRPADTTGAGDIFGGSAAARLLELGKAPEELTEQDLHFIASYASAAAGLSTEKRGGIPSIPARETVLAVLEKQKHFPSERA